MHYFITLLQWTLRGKEMESESEILDTNDSFAQ